MPLIYRLKQVYLRFLHLTCLLIIEQLNNYKTKLEELKKKYVPTDENAEKKSDKK